MPRFSLLAATAFWRPLRQALCGLALAGAAAVAHAVTPLMIWPVDPVITEGNSAVAVWIENRGASPVSLQVRVLGWSQLNGEETLVPQKAVVPSPPISVIPPGKRQMVRLVAMQPLASGLEAAYRVLVDELPPPADQAPAESDTQQAGMGIRLKVRYAIPLFVYGGDARPFRPNRVSHPFTEGTPLPPALTWRTEKNGNRPRLVVRNAGRGHARITAVRWGSARATPLAALDASINEGLMGYVLPQSEMAWDLPAPPPAEPVLKATINGEDTQIPRGEE